MRRYLILALAAIGLVAAAPSAFATRVIFDPPQTQSSAGAGCSQYTPCNIGMLNTPYQVGFVPCSDVLGVSTAGYTWCLWMNNVTLHSVSKFTFEFTVPSGGSYSGADLQCASIPPGFATDNCPQSLPNVGSLFDVSFFTDPALPNRTDFYLFTDFYNSPGMATVTLSVPEPGELSLFGLGLLALGLGYGWRKRRQMRGDGA